MITITPLTSFTAEDLKRVITGYTTQAKYEVVKVETAVISISPFIFPVAYVMMGQLWHETMNKGGFCGKETGCITGRVFTVGSCFVVWKV
jgi:hypothetical protein